MEEGQGIGVFHDSMSMDSDGDGPSSPTSLGGRYADPSGEEVTSELFNDHTLASKIRALRAQILGKNLLLSTIRFSVPFFVLAV